VHEQPVQTEEERDLYPSITKAELNQVAWLVGAEVLPQRDYGAAGQNVMVKAICLAVLAREKRGLSGLSSFLSFSARSENQPLTKKQQMIKMQIESGAVVPTTGNESSAKNLEEHHERYQTHTPA
jgi:hypothetical protein